LNKTKSPVIVHHCSKSRVGKRFGSRATSAFWNSTEGCIFGGTNCLLKSICGGLPSLRHYYRPRFYPRPVVTGRPMRRRIIGPAPSGLGEGLAGRDFLVTSRSIDSCGGPDTCTLTWSPGVRCFLRHIGAAGFWVKQALCQEAVRLGWVVFRRTHGSRSSALPGVLYGNCSDGTRL
jgi:hypothetical protein